MESREWRGWALGFAWYIACSIAAMQNTESQQQYSVFPFVFSIMVKSKAAFL
jgi:hypothetical protein